MPFTFTFSVQQRRTPPMKEAIVKNQHSERGHIQVYLFHLLEHPQSLMHIICLKNHFLVLLNSQWSQLNQERAYV